MIGAAGLTGGAAGPPAGSRTPLRGNSSYRRLWSAVAISETGDWLLFIALPLYVLQVSGSALATSSVFLAELLPAVVVGTACGPVIDRIHPARLLSLLTGSQAVVLLPLLWLGPGRLWLVYPVTVVQSALTSVTTPAQQALVSTLVGPGDLPAANAMVEVAGNVARLIGSPLGGFLLPLLGVEGLVLGDAASFILSAALLAGCRGSAARDEVPREARAAGRLGAVAVGWHAVRRETTLMSALTISFVGAVAQGLFLVLFVLFVLRSLHSGAEVVGLLRGVQAVGGVAGGLMVGAWAARLGARALTVGGLTAFAAVSLLAWNSPPLTTDTWWYVGLFAAVGIPAAALTTGLITGIQRASPPGVLGRTLSLMQAAQALGQGTGILAAGLLSASISLTVLLNLQAGCYVACALVAAMGFARRRRRRRRPVPGTRASRRRRGSQG
ncbi:MAG TPA: MFS transporter [Solirubrobacteraceae bacterium]|nr:MFS transporter [Solirubrobacteraceae bacterium]